MNEHLLNQSCTDPYVRHLSAFPLQVVYQFLNHMGEIWMCVVTCVCPPGWQACRLALQNIYIGHNLSTKFCHACRVPLTSTINNFYATVSDLDHGWGSQGQRKANSVGFIFLHTFQLMRMKFDVVQKQFRLNVLILILSEVRWIKGNNFCLTHCMKNL